MTDFTGIDQKGAQQQHSLSHDTGSLVGAITKGLRLRRPDAQMQQQQQQGQSSQQQQQAKPGTSFYF